MALVTAGQFALILRMRVLLNRIRSSDRAIVRIERKELSDIEKGDVEKIKSDFRDEMAALHTETDKLRALFHDEALYIMRNVDKHIENAIGFIRTLEQKGFPEKEARALADQLEAEIKNLMQKLGLTEDEIERIRNYMGELESGAVRKAA
jgi:hypothetical protein